ncbi:UNVERIFIED_CONTAM: hypothetical protein Slati_3910200 [Sesamum latifolium]|uniref:Reverse transcriptase/retrotransposon-derived protein RNase H-like domain-containing protein n=1 Tax=Sesamum latifolium TaxID=2727402 RepID=A0AAW2TP37_9LAMI
MTTGGPARGDSQRARKASIREADGTSRKEVMGIEPTDDTPLIQFYQEERRRPKTQGNDALVIIALLANYEIERVFIDSGSSTDILFGEAYDQMQLRDIPLKTAALPCTASHERICLLKFLVVDIPSAYNVILERPTLNAFRAVISTYHMKIKFPVIGGVGEAQVNTLQACKCYVEAIKKEPKEDAPVMVQPVEELLTLKLIPGDPGKDTKIGSKLKDDVRDQVVKCLQENKDIFAWTPRTWRG